MLRQPNPIVCELAPAFVAPLFLVCTGTVDAFQEQCFSTEKLYAMPNDDYEDDEEEDDEDFDESEDDEDEDEYEDDEDMDEDDEDDDVIIEDDDDEEDEDEDDSEYEYDEDEDEGGDSRVVRRIMTKEQ